MPFDINALIAAHAGENHSLYEAHVNPRFARALKIIGFNRNYVRGKGAYLWDDAGRQYLDMLAGYGVFNIGRNHPVVKQALQDMMAKDCSSLVQMETPLLCGLLAHELKRRIGYDLDYVYFCSTGAEGVETAIKFARRATGRNRILYASSAFHGLTTGALSLNGSDIFREGFGPLGDSAKVPFGDVEALQRELAKGDVAAFFVEPVQGKGVQIPPEGYLADATRLCRRHGSLLVADEVQTGMGRTGKFLAMHHETGAEPDMVIMSKALSGGFVPVAAVLMRRAVYDRVFSSLDRAVVHSSTFGKSNFAMAAGLASLAVLDEEGLMANATAMGDRLGNRLLELKSRYEFIHDVRWRGLMVGIEFARPRSLKLKTAWAAAHKLNEDLFCQAVTIPLLADHGVLTQVAGNRMTTIKLIPPLVLTPADVDRFIDAFDQVMAGLHRFPGPAWDTLARIARNALAPATKRTEVGAK
jgi:acetylornithine/succinyldiaminopimelate/putrescine aminotransferase